MVDVTCSSAESRSLTTSPSIVKLLTLSMACTGEDGCARACIPREPGAVITISIELDWLRPILLDKAYSLTFFISLSQVKELVLGTSK